MKDDLKNLASPLNLPLYLKVDSCDDKFLKEALNLMVSIRLTEEKIANGRRDGLIGGPVHLGAGQEAIAVGVSKHLNKDDAVFGGHRSHPHLLALNNNYYKLFAEVLGKETGFSRGMGGSMHLFDRSSAFCGSTPIVAGTVPLAVGAGLAFKLNNKKNIAVSYLGDGAIEEGVVHESFNLARVMNSPVLFVIENNLFSSHMHISLRQSSNKISRFAEANDIPYSVIDGNDVVAINDSSRKLIKSIRGGAGPMLLECITYRHYGHVDWRDDIDVGVERSEEDVKNWKARDPIILLSKTLINKKIIDENYLAIIKQKISNKIESAWELALSDNFPSKDSTLDFVYSRQP